MKRVLLIIGVLLTLAIIGWFVNKRDKKKDTAISCTVLPPEIREKIIVDPRHNSLIVITKERTDTMFLPDRPTSIEIPYKGDIRITRRTWGFEMAPFAALVVTDTLRAGVGVDGFYWNKINFGSGIGLNVPNLLGNKQDVSLKRLLDVSFFTHISYNVYSNSSIGIVLDTNKKIGLDFSFRF